MKMTVKLLDVDDKCWIQWWRWFYDETEASLMIIPCLTSHLGARTRNIQHSLILQWKSSTPQICERH